MNSIEKKLTLPENCDSVLAAVSGGADSVCMLHLLVRRAKRTGMRVCAAHYEHGIRGAEALRDAAFAAPAAGLTSGITLVASLPGAFAGAAAKKKKRRK